MLRKTIHATLLVILMMGAASAQTDFFKGSGENSLRGQNREQKKDDGESKTKGVIDRKQIDNDYKAVTSKIPDQKPTDPWGAIRPAPSTPSPKTPTVAGAKKKQQ